MKIKGFRVFFPKSTGRRKGIAYLSSLEGALFLAPSREIAMAWMTELGRGKNTAPLYYVEVEAQKWEKNKWCSILPQIIVYPPFRILRIEKCKEVSWKEAARIYNGRFRALEKRTR